MSTYYNEIDPFAAQWLRELIKAGHIAPGEVDERSIEDVVPSELMGYTQCHFFAGIGVWSHALRQAGWPDDRPIWTGSCPCQPFSAAGKGGGTSDERHLWPAFEWLIRQCRPDCVLGEQVESAIKHDWLDHVALSLESIGYSVGAVGFPACSTGAPHIRQRLYWMAKSECGGQQGKGIHLPSRKPRQAVSVSAGGSPARRVADASDSRREPIEGKCGVPREEVGDKPVSEPWIGGNAGVLADSEHDGHGRQAEWLETEQNSDEQGERVSGGDCSAGVLGDSGGERLQEQRSERGTSCGQVGADQGQAVERTGAPTNGVGHSDSARLQEQQRGLEQSERFAPPGPTNGFWRNAEWLPCRDGKARPVEPGTFPLVDGAAARVGRLRGYGNAIVAPQAEAFIRAVMETTNGR